MASTAASKARDEPANGAGLVYLPDYEPGLRRHKTRDGFRYVDPQGRPLRDGAELSRIKRLAIPPAWTDVWISPSAEGHIQATGRDARGRKQYRYHPLWRKVRDEAKFDRTIAFAEALPRIRHRVEADLRLPGLPREKVLATVVSLLEATNIRVGYEEYARDNGSFGLTTMRDRHVEVERDVVRFEFRGKSGRLHSVGLKDRRLATIVARCRDIKGYELFQYIDEEGRRQRVDADDVNAYLRESAGDDFSTKDFRTWKATLLAAQLLTAAEPAKTAGETKRRLAETVESVARDLGNTPAVSRNSYIHPDVLDAYSNGGLGNGWKAMSRPRKGLSGEESAVLRLLKRLRQAKAA